MNTNLSTEENAMLAICWLETLEQLASKWSIQASAVEIIYGVDTPAAKALRSCIGDLNRTIGIK